MGVRTEDKGAAIVVTMAWPETRNAIGPDEADEVAGARVEQVFTPEQGGGTHWLAPLFSDAL